MDKQEADETFEIAAKDAQCWLNKANRLKLSADIIKPELNRVLEDIRFRNGLDQKALALMESYMLLIGITFENLIKGILIGRNASLVSTEGIDKKILPRGGHGISEGSKKVAVVTDEELDLLKRLEEQVVWGGRYIMPTKPSIYQSSHNPENRRSFRLSDFELIERLFSRLSNVLVDEWKIRDNSPRRP